MPDIDILKDNKFGPFPSDYAGYWPNPEDYIILGRNRDSSILYNINFEVAQNRLYEAARRLDGTDGIDDVAEEFIIFWRARHWACGWVEYLGVRHDAPEPLLEEAAAILEELQTYPVLDDDAYSEAQAEAAQELWDELGEDERRDVFETYDLPVPENLAEADWPAEFIEAYEIY